VLTKQTQIPTRQIRAVFTDTTVRVYQAFNVAIALPALAGGRFVTPFSMTRMTWVKPSFLWMMYRSSWGTAPNQEAVLAIDITRQGFEQALTHACLSSFDPAVDADAVAWKQRLVTSSNRIQWDPEKNINLQPLAHKSLQLGIGGAAVADYVNEWIVGIQSCDALIESIRTCLDRGDRNAAERLLPIERPYPLPGPVARCIGADA
jgi:Domain of unknown function (DUF4291)